MDLLRPRLGKRCRFDRLPQHDALPVEDRPGGHVSPGVHDAEPAHPLRDPGRGKRALRPSPRNRSGPFPDSMFRFHSEQSHPDAVSAPRFSSRNRASNRSPPPRRTSVFTRWRSIPSPPRGTANSAARRLPRRRTVTDASRPAVKQRGAAPEVIASGRSPVAVIRLPEGSPLPRIDPEGGQDRGVFQHHGVVDARGPVERPGRPAELLVVPFLPPRQHVPERHRPPGREISVTAPPSWAWASRVSPDVFRSSSSPPSRSMSPRAASVHRSFSPCRTASDAASARRRFAYAASRRWLR